MSWSSAWTVWQFVIRQEGGRCIEFSVSTANGWSFVTKLDDVFRNLDFEVEVSCSSDILICLVVLLSLTADSSLVRPFPVHSLSAHDVLSLTLPRHSVQCPVAIRLVSFQTASGGTKCSTRGAADIRKPESAPNLFLDAILVCHCRYHDYSCVHSYHFGSLMLIAPNKRWFISFSSS